MGVGGWVRGVVGRVRHRVGGGGGGGVVPVEVSSVLGVVPSLVSAGDWAGLVDLLEPVLEGFGESVSPEVYARLGLAYRRLGELERAEVVVSRGRERFRSSVRLDVEWALLAVDDGNWVVGIERLGWVLERWGDDGVPVGVFVFLVRGLGVLEDVERAEAVVERGFVVFPGDVRLWLEWAQLAVVEGDWGVVAERLESLVARVGLDSVSSVVLVRLVRAYRERRQFGLAGAVLGVARSRFPEVVALDVEWVELAMAQRRWALVVERLEWVVGVHGDSNVPVEVFVWWVRALRKLGEFGLADEVVGRGFVVFPSHVRLWVEWAEVAAAEGEWGAVTERLGSALESAAVPVVVFGRLARALGELGEVDAAARVVGRGVEVFPDDVGLVSHWAQLAMVGGDWEEALVRWDRFVALSQGESGSGLVVVLPQRGGVLDWDEVVWLRLVAGWPVGVAVSLGLFRALVAVLVRIRGWDEARWVVGEALRVFPDDPGLRFDQLVIDLSDPKAPNPDISSTTDDVAANSAKLIAGHRSDSFGRSSFRRLRIPRGSSIELEIRAGRHLSASDVRDQVRALSERDEWPESMSPENPMEPLARRLSRIYAKKYAQPPFLTVETLAEAIYFIVYSELWGYVAMRRLAQKLAPESAGEPIFLEITSSRISYLNGYAETEFEMIILYRELQHLGANPYLVQFVNGPIDSTKAARLAFYPNRAFMQSRAIDRELEPPDSGVGIVPAGIRSITGVIADLGDPVVYSSTALVPEFAYERAYASEVRPSASFMGPRSLLRKITIDFWRSEMLRGVQLDTAASELVEVAVEVSAPIEHNWLRQLGNVVQKLLVAMARRSHTEAALRNLTEIHIGDHPYPESAIMAGTVKARGGRVVLWPHSTNPAHIDLRRPGSFDVVHALTKTGCEQWQSRFPDVNVVHEASLMLVAPTTLPDVDPTSSLSVVVIGGMNTLGAMPFVHASLHEDSYRRFFDGLNELQLSAPIDVYYKPKGSDGENETWLRRIVGDAAGWRRIIQHPLKIDLANPVFVSISVGSGALLEGLGRGIPALIVKDFPAREYLAVAPEVLPIGSAAETLKLIHSLTDLQQYEAFRSQQLDQYLVEIGADS